MVKQGSGSDPTQRVAVMSAGVAQSGIYKKNIRCLKGPFRCKSANSFLPQRHKILEEIMHKLITALACAMALTVTFSPLANADFESPKITVSHIAKHITPRQQVAGHCVKAIQQLWDRPARLVLDFRAHLRDSDTQLTTLVNGWVWEQGQRVQKQYQCTTDKTTQEFALQVLVAEQPLIASQ